LNETLVNLGKVLENEYEDRYFLTFDNLLHNLRIFLNSVEVIEKINDKKETSFYYIFD